MRHLAAATAMALALAAGTGVRAQEAQPPDPIARMLTLLDVELASPDRDALTASLGLTPPVRDWLDRHVPLGDDTFISIVERARSAAHVLAEVFIARGARGTLATWNIAAVPAPTSSGVRVIEIVEVSRYADLVRLELTGNRAYHVVDLVVTGPDFTLTLPSGTMFASLVADRPTALVLLGQAQVRFTPLDPAEQGQLRIFTGSPVLETSIDTAFVRINPIDAADAIRWRERREIPVEAAVLSEARATLEARAPLSFQVDPVANAPGMWSEEPGIDSRLVDFRSTDYGWLTYARSPDEIEDVALFDRADRKQISLYPYEPSPSVLLATPALEIVGVDLDLTFDPARLWFGGLARLSLDLNRRVSSIAFRLDEALTVDNVWSPQAGYLLTIRSAGEDTVTIALPTDVDRGPFTLEIQYHGRVEPQRLSSDRVDGARPNLSLDDFPWPIEPRYLYTIGRWWYPFAQGGVQAATVRLTVPEEYRAVSNGQLVETIVTDAEPGRWPSTPGRVASFEYRTERPVPYLSFLVARTDAVGTARATTPGADPTTTSAGSVDGVDIAAFVGRSRSTHLRNTPDRVRAIVEFYGTVLGGAPYPSLTVVTLEDLMPGGHSPAYFSLVNVPHAATPLIWSRDPAAFEDAPDFFLAHEIAHQWWGQAVAARTYRGQWISEGFAQYMAWLYETATLGEATGHRLMSRMRSTSEGLVAEGPIQLGSRLGHLRDNRRIFRSLVYNKSAVVLHMLRRLVGDDAFFAGLRRLYAEHRYERTTTNQVRMAFEAEVDMPLGRYFDRWIYGATVPHLRFEWTQAGDDQITVHAEQIGDTFDVPYDVTIEYVDGTRERHLLKLDEASESFAIPIRAPVRRVLFEDELTLANVLMR